MKTIARASFTACIVLTLVTMGCKKDENKPPGPPSGGDKIAEGVKQLGTEIADSTKAAWQVTKESVKELGEYVGEGADKVAKEGSEAWITTKLKAKIGVTKLFGVSVTTNKGQVTLTGKVKHQDEIDLITRLARETDGVKSVVNNLVIETPAKP